MIIPTAVIIPAAGSGTRMKLDHPKQFHKLSGAPILIHTIRAFQTCPSVKQLIVVAPENMVPETNKLIADHFIDKVEVIPGGRRRQDSVFQGLQCVISDIELVLVHDGARPMIRKPLIEECISQAHQHGAAIAAIPVKDTLKKEDQQGYIDSTISRDNLWQAQTPQVARVELLKKAYKINDDRDVTDEAGLMEAAEIPVVLVMGAETNIKITRPEDLEIASNSLKKMTTPKIRIGHGFDAHALSSKRELVLGGVTIPHKMGLAGHSDADVLTHALCDAILGAMGAGDIGKHFPDSSAEFKDIYSIKLLEQVIDTAVQKSFSIANIDITVVCQAPKLAPHLEKMKIILAKTCRIEIGQLNIKATTTERMGFTGRKEGISCHAVVLLQEQD